VEYSSSVAVYSAADENGTKYVGLSEKGQLWLTNAWLST
jgi:hypothetical protein